MGHDWHVATTEEVLYPYPPCLFEYSTDSPRMNVCSSSTGEKLIQELSA